MNTIAHLAAMIALMWGSVTFAEVTLKETPLSVALLFLFFAWIPLTVMAVVDDVNGVRRGRRE